MRRIAALALAGILSLTLATSALAATVDETLTVATAVSMSGVPATLNYGTVTPGVASSAQTFTITINANAAWVVDMYAVDDFVGPGTLSKGARQVRTTAVSGAGTSSSITSYTAFGAAGLTGPSASASEIDGGPVSGATADLSFRILAPASTAPGVYAGQFTITIAAF